jgi:hypothetical protein
VLLERLKGLFVDLPQFTLFQLQPDSEVNHRVEMEADTRVGVPSLHKSLLVLFDEVLKV